MSSSWLPKTDSAPPPMEAPANNIGGTHHTHFPYPNRIGFASSLSDLSRFEIVSYSWGEYVALYRDGRLQYRPPIRKKTQTRRWRRYTRRDGRQGSSTERGRVLAAVQVNANVRFEPEEIPPRPITVGLGVQAAVVTLAPIVIGVLIVMRAVQASDSYLAWSAFAALFISGLTTLVQAVRFGRIGSGHILIMGTSGAFFAVCIAAIVQGGPALMASLIVVSSLVQFLLAAKLSLLRRIFTPVVAGSVIMLIAATVMPIVFDMVDDVPEGTPSFAAPLVAVISLVVVAGLVLRGSPAVRLWAPIAALVVGCAVSAGFGMYDVQTIIDAPWIGVPFSSWPGLDVTPGVEFWALLPAFIAVTIVGAIETVGDGVASSGCRGAGHRRRTSGWCRDA